RAEVLLRVVDVHGAERREADGAVERFHRRGPAIRRAELVTRGEDVTGIEAHAETLRVLRRADHVAQLLEARADARPLPGRGLEPDRRGRAWPGRGTRD